MQKFFKVSFNILLICTLPLFLSGCLSVAVNGAKLIYNRHEIMESLENYNIANKAKKIIYHDKAFAKCNIQTSSFNYELLLYGQVSNKQLRQTAAKRILHIPRLKTVFNYLTIGKNASLAERSRDSWITGKVKAQLIANNDIVPDEIKVITEKNTVYLLGYVKRNQAKITIEIARHTRGVKKVVSLLRIITIK